jgi:hypothetical protein
MSKRVYLLGVGLLVALAFVITDGLLWEPGVTEANVRRIRRGRQAPDSNSIRGLTPLARPAPGVLTSPRP